MFLPKSLIYINFDRRSGKQKSILTGGPSRTNPLQPDRPCPPMILVTCSSMGCDGKNAAIEGHAWYRYRHHNVLIITRIKNLLIYLCSWSNMTNFKLLLPIMAIAPELGSRKLGACIKYLLISNADHGVPNATHHHCLSNQNMTS